MAVVGMDLMAPILPEVILQMGGVPLVPYAKPGSAKLAEDVVVFVRDHDAFLMANHGATAVGTTLTLAHQRMESLEHAARIVCAAHSLGTVRELAPDEVRALRMLREGTG
jgi:L-fuculose-phosphate aldolase